MMIGLRPILSDSQPKTTKNGVPSSSDDGDQQVAPWCRRPSASGSGRTARRTGRVYQTTAWPAVSAEQREEHDLDVLPAGRTPRSAAPSSALPSAFIFWKAGDSFELQPDPDRDAEQDDREQERNAPAPVGERLRRHAEAQRRG